MMRVRLTRLESDDDGDFAVTVEAEIEVEDSFNPSILHDLVNRALELSGAAVEIERGSLGVEDPDPDTN